ncbi:MAG: hypothetical protein NTW32_26100 [Chloroflexi bacterium]|nr:hypothetical protein [Chloroflexota bacterium]
MGDTEISALSSSLIDHRTLSRLTLPMIRGPLGHIIVVCSKSEMVIAANSLFDSQTVLTGDNNNCLLEWPVYLMAEAGRM